MKIALTLILIFSIVAASWMYARNISQLKNDNRKTGIGEELFTDWTIYTNKEKGFSIKYPTQWNKFENEILGFGPTNSSEDAIWSIKMYPLNTNIEAISTAIGSQFSDRIEKIETVVHTVDNAAQKITVTSPSNPDWESILVVIKSKDTVYVLSNGGVKDSELWKRPEISAAINFDYFYKSFSLTNSEESSKNELGTVTGKLCTSPSAAKTGEIIAKNTANEERTIKKIETPTESYTLILSPGEYKLRFQSIDEEGGMAYSYYTDQKNLKTVMIKAGSTVSGVDLCDYAKENPEYQQQLGSSF